ncbi:MAG: NADH-quinone oxidoreductase subunit M [Actinobacteria bacterium]|nr:NADH-quinone oxidoreductase subunit M [Actinomycetota bacterium]MBI3686535.1 NADH-quinone oxidoreductase subunit M [Actinomycetota bacterium]
MIVVLLALPFAGAMLAPLVRGDRAARWFGVAVTAMTFAVSLTLLSGIGGPVRGTVDARHAIDVPWIPALGVRFHVGVDGVSLPLVLLTTLLCLLSAIYTLTALPAPGKAPLLTCVVLATEVGMLGTFVALDLVLFFVFFEVVLLPMYVLIAVWGGPGGRAAALKFVLYTLLGSVLVLVGIGTVYAATGSVDVVALSGRGGAGIAHGTQVAAFLALFAGFAVKAPLYPLHTWLPDAHTEAPTVGSVLLAGVLLKMGTYGLVRVAVPILPDGARAIAPAMAVLAVAGIVVGSLNCLVQRDVKRLIAYSSVGHMGFVLLGIATLTPTGINAALLANIAHGIITGLLFFAVGAVKDRYHTADLPTLGSGLMARLPVLGGLLLVGSVASLGLPGLAGFWGEAFVLLSAFQPASGLPGSLFTALLVVAGVGAALTAAYFLRLLRMLVTGPDVSAAAAETSGGVGVVADANRVELLAWLPLVLLAVAIGLYPKLVLGLTEAPVRALMGVFGS